MSGPITRARLLELFDRLNEKLKQADQQGELYIVGGAMMALAHDAKRVTADVDLHIRRGRAAVTRGGRRARGRRGPEQVQAERGSDHALPARRSRPGRAARLRQLAPDNRGCLDQPDDRDEAERGSSAGPGYLDILLKEAGVETRREAVRLHELTYGTEPMAAEADLIKRYGRRRDWDTGPTR